VLDLPQSAKSPTGRHLTHKPLICQKPLFCKGFSNSTATIRCYYARYGRGAEIPLHGPPERVEKLLLQAASAEGLQAEGRPKQIWRSLDTDNEAASKVAYRTVDAETDALLAEWRQDDSQPVGAGLPQSPVKSVPNYAPLTPALLRRLADAHYLHVYENDFQWRGELWKKVHEDEDAFWRGEVIKLPEDDWHDFRGEQRSYFAHLMEEPVLEDVFLYSVFHARKAKLQCLKRLYELGDSREYGSVANALLLSKAISLSDADRQRLMRKVMEVEIKALEDLSAGNEATFDRIVERQTTAKTSSGSASATKPGELMSRLVEKYLEDASREREWPTKTALRKQSELREFTEIAGDKPVNEYRQTDGVTFKDIQLALPANRQKAPFKGLTLGEAANRTSELRASGEEVDLLNPITINDKIGTVSLYFEWAKSRDSSVINPLAGLRIQRAKNNRKGKKRHPWTIDELNRMFAAPIYTGCRSERHWQQPGDVVLRQSAKYWVPTSNLNDLLRPRGRSILQYDRPHYPPHQIAPDLKTSNGIDRRSVCAECCSPQRGTACS
jgi:hypothetical protein